MIYFTSTMSRDEIIQLIPHVNIDAFCLWQGTKGEDLYGVIKESAYELFIVACSLSMVQDMKLLSLKQITETSGNGERFIICGNRKLMEA
jgi:hypothetical protein